MKNAKMTVVAIMAAVMSMCCNSLSAKTFSVEGTAGVGFSNYKINSLKLEGTGFRVGAIGQLSVPKVKGLYCNAGVLLSMEGFNFDILGTQLKASPFFLNIPVHVGYSYSIIDKLSVFGEFGPYVGVGLFGNFKYVFSDSESYKVPLFKADEMGEIPMERVHFGLGFKIGLVAFSHYKLSFGWDWNLLNSAKATGENGQRMNHNNAYLTLSYVF